MEAAKEEERAMEIEAEIIKQRHEVWEEKELRVEANLEKKVEQKIEKKVEENVSAQRLEEVLRPFPL